MIEEANQLHLQILQQQKAPGKADGKIYYISNIKLAFNMSKIPIISEVPEIPPKTSPQNVSRNSSVKSIAKSETAKSETALTETVDTKTVDSGRVKHSNNIS